jgi:hypothetical protein
MCFYLESIIVKAVQVDGVTVQSEGLGIKI